MRVIGAGIRAFQTGSAYAVGAFASIAAGAGLLGIAFFLLAVAVTAATKAFKFAIGEAEAFSNRRAGAGATTTDQATLDRVAIAVGMKKEQMSALASRTPGFAQGLLGILNALDAGPKRSHEDYGKMLNVMGLPTQLANLFRMSEGQRANVLRGDPSDAVVEEKDQQRAFEFLLLVRETFEKIAKAVREAGYTILNFFYNVADVFRGLREAMYKFVGKIPVIGPLFDQALQSTQGMDLKAGFLEILKAAVPSLKMFERNHFKGNEDNGKRLNNAASSLDTAATKLSGAAVALAFTNKSGVFGGIDVVRASRAYPTNWAWAWGELHKRNMDDQVYLGAFTI
jgi:hypothetical protein